MNESVEKLIAELKALREKAMPAPWSECGADRGGCSCGMISFAHGPIAEMVRGEWGDIFPDLRLVEEAGTIGNKVEAFINKIPYGEVPPEVAHANAAYIVALVNAAPQLFAATESLTRERDATLEREAALRHGLEAYREAHDSDPDMICLTDDDLCDCDLCNSARRALGKDQPPPK
jgi:hypothetical protein